MNLSLESRLIQAIRNVPDFPKPGIMFRDITTALLDAGLMQEALEAIWSPFAGKADVVAGIESRGFILGAALAWSKGLPFVPMRKPGKLPAAVYRESYALEYGNDSLEVHQDAIASGSRVLIVDDLLATGGTAEAAARLVARTGALTAGFSFLVELDFLKGRAGLEAHPVHSVVHYAEE